MEERHFYIMLCIKESYSSRELEQQIDSGYCERYMLSKEKLFNHPVLGTWGGHCGYSVRPKERRKGYAKEMLRLNIENARKIGIEKLLVTCDVKNAATEKTILANGGIFEKIIDVDGCQMKRYWITV